MTAAQTQRNRTIGSADFCIREQCAPAAQRIQVKRAKAVELIQTVENPWKNREDRSSLELPRLSKNLRKTRKGRTLSNFQTYQAACAMVAIRLFAAKRLSSRAKTGEGGSGEPASSFTSLLKPFLTSSEALSSFQSCPENPKDFSKNSPGWRERLLSPSTSFTAMKRRHNIGDQTLKSQATEDSRTSCIRLRMG